MYARAGESVDHRRNNPIRIASTELSDISAGSRCQLTKGVSVCIAQAADVQQNRVTHKGNDQRKINRGELL